MTLQELGQPFGIEEEVNVRFAVDEIPHISRRQQLE
jgi:hypothetical protein